MKYFCLGNLKFFSVTEKLFRFSA